MAKAAIWTVTDAQTRKRGEQTGLDTLVVHAVNVGCSSSRVLTPAVTKLTREAPRLGSTVARLKLKEIDGGPHKRWSMWFNSKQRAEPYLDLTSSESRRKTRVPSGAERQVLHGKIGRASCRERV